MQGKQIVRYDVGNPEHLKQLTVSGAIWSTPYAQRGIDAIREGLVKLEECQNMPPKIKAAL